MSYPKREIKRLRSAQAALRDVDRRGYECMTLARIINGEIEDLINRIEKEDSEIKNEFNLIHKGMWGY